MSDSVDGTIIYFAPACTAGECYSLALLLLARATATRLACSAAKSVLRAILAVILRLSVFKHFEASFSRKKKFDKNQIMPRGRGGRGGRGRGRGKKRAFVSIPAVIEEIDIPELDPQEAGPSRKKTKLENDGGLSSEFENSEDFLRDIYSVEPHDEESEQNEQNEQNEVAIATQGMHFFCRYVNVIQNPNMPTESTKL